MSRSVFFRSVIFTAALTIASVVMSSGAQAADLTWGGTYRVEAVKIRGSEMTSEATDNSYMLHHLVLTPKLVAADGFTIFSRLDLLNNSQFGIDNNGTVTSVAGDTFGNGPDNVTSASGGNPARGTDSNAWGRTQRAGNIAVTALYGTWTQEFGQVIVGRVPMQFGLGTAFNAGNGAFDHYIDTKDMIAYKVVFGNLSVMPMLAKNNEGYLGVEDDVNDYMVQVQYENPETELTLGAIYDIKVVTGNDSPIATSPAVGPIGGPGATRGGSFKNTLMAFYFSEKPMNSLRASFEADLLSGDTGVNTGPGVTPALAGVGLNAFGVAGELAWTPQESKWSGLLKFGLVTGDDPGTNDVYEGYQFNRNYKTGLLLFNHPLGQRDFLRTGLVRDASGTGTGKASNQIDDEAMSNAMYIAPNVQFKAKDNLSFGGTFVYAMLNKDPIKDATTGAGVGTSMNLGYELDLNVTYKPIERLSWVTEIGALLPGAAWQAGSQQLESKMVFGAVTKAAITF